MQITFWIVFTVEIIFQNTNRPKHYFQIKTCAWGITDSVDNMKGFCRAIMCEALLRSSKCQYFFFLPLMLPVVTTGDWHIIITALILISFHIYTACGEPVAKRTFHLSRRLVKQSTFTDCQNYFKYINLTMSFPLHQVFSRFQYGI